MGAFLGSFGHGAGDFGAHGSAAFDQLRRDSEDLGFCRVRVGHEAFVENLGGAGDIGDAACQKAAGAGFRRGEGEAVPLEFGDDPFFDPLA